MGLGSGRRRRGLTFTKPPNPYVALAAVFLMGAAVASLLTWLIVRPGQAPAQDGAAVLRTVNGVAVLNERRTRMDLTVDDEELPGLRLTAIAAGRNCLRESEEPAVSVSVRLVTIPPPEDGGRVRHVVVGVECLGPAAGMP